MSIYTDIFVAPILKARMTDYRKIAETAETVYREHGALYYVEVEADDAKPGNRTEFPQSVDPKDDEFVMVAIITYRSREHRDEVNAKAMNDPREVTLIEADAETTLRVGDAATFAAGVAWGHHLENRTGTAARYLGVGTRAPVDRITWPDHDRICHRERAQPDDIWTNGAGNPASNPFRDKA